MQTSKSVFFPRRNEKKNKIQMNRNYHHTAVEDDVSATDDEDDEAASSGSGEEEEVVEETQFAQQQQLPILTSPITEGGRYQLRSTPDRLAASQRRQQQQPRYPFIDAARLRGSSAGRTGVANATTTTARINATLNAPVGANATSTMNKNNIIGNTNNNSNATGVDALLLASGAAATTAANGTESRSNNNNITNTNPSRSASVTACAPRYQSGKASRSKGTKNFSNDELNSILELIKKVLPTGNEFWELVVKLHKEKFLEMNQNAASIKKILQTGQRETWHWKSFHFQHYTKSQKN